MSYNERYSNQNHHQPNWYFDENRQNRDSKDPNHFDKGMNTSLYDMGSIKNIGKQM